MKGDTIYDDLPHISASVPMQVGDGTYQYIPVQIYFEVKDNGWLGNEGDYITNLSDHTINAKFFVSAMLLWGDCHWDSLSNTCMFEIQGQSMSVDRFINIQTFSGFRWYSSNNLLTAGETSLIIILLICGINLICGKE